MSSAQKAAQGQPANTNSGGNHHTGKSFSADRTSVPFEKSIRTVVREEIDRSMPYLVQEQIGISPAHDPHAEMQVLSNILGNVVTLEELQGLEPEHFFSAHLGTLYSVALHGLETGIRFDQAAYVLACQKAGAGSFKVQGMLLEYLDLHMPVSLVPGTRVLADRIRELWAWRQFFSSVFEMDHALRTGAVSSLEKSRAASVINVRFELKSHLDTLRSRLTVTKNKGEEK